MSGKTRKTPPNATAEMLPPQPHKVGVMPMVTAVLVLAAGGWGHAALSGYLNRAGGKVPFPPGTLAELPTQIGRWNGTDIPLEEAVIRTADVDDYVNRKYVRDSDNQAVGLWVAFGINARDLMPHRPEVCYPGAGWTLKKREAVEVSLPGGGTLRTMILSFTAGGLDQRPLTVANFYIVDDQTCEEVSLLRSKAWRGQGAIRYMAQIQITCREYPGGGYQSPEQVVQQFASVLYGPLRTLLDATIESDSGSARASHGLLRRALVLGTSSSGELRLVGDGANAL